MKRANFTFETVLISITVFVGLLTALSFEFILWGFLWMLPLGVLQLIHALILVVNYWDDRKSRNLLLIYWAVVLSFFIGLYILRPINWGDDQFILLPIIPLALALYLWLITYTCLQKHPSISLNAEAEQHLDFSSSKNPTNETF